MDNQGANVQKSDGLFQEGFAALRTEAVVGENIKPGGGHHTRSEFQKVMRVLRIRHRKVLPVVDIRPAALGRGAEYTVK